MAHEHEHEHDGCGCGHDHDRTGWLRFLDERFLMGIAVFGAICIGEWLEGAAVLLLYCIGEFFQHMAVRRSRRSIQSLMDIRPDRAARLIDGIPVDTPAAEVMPGAYILVRAGERIPLDGVVSTGASQLDTAALTGESIPRDVVEGDEVLAGCVNLSGTLTIRVTKPFGESTASKILELAENAAQNKAPAERFIAKFARIYTPIVVAIALLIATLPPLLFGAEWSDFIHRALVFLVISCPCALVISVPMGFFAGIGCASKNGILVKGGNYLEALCSAELAVFDKTGTLTQGKLRVTEVAALGMEEAALLCLAAHAEAHSTHPIAAALRGAYGAEIDHSRVAEVSERAGYGITARVDGREVLAGSRRQLEEEGIALPELPEPVGTAVYVAVDGTYCGRIAVADRQKPEASEAIRDLKSLGIRRTVMLTGDRQAAGEALVREVGLDEIYGDLLPDGKAEKLESLLRGVSRKGKLLYIGDGINDAPVLARADVGIAMGGIGSDAALESADIVVMDDKLTRIPLAIRIARRTRAIVTQNIVFSIGVKVIVLTLGALGFASMWGAVFADVGVALLAVLNAMRALRASQV